MPNNLNESLLDNGIQNTNYFNGRILDADALRTDQDANRRQHAQLGRAIGAGVVEGLEVAIAPESSAERPVVRIKQGLAINRFGQVLELSTGSTSIDYLSLSLSSATAANATIGSAGLFTPCSLPPPTANSLTGVYILVIAPVSGFKELAAAKSLTNTGGSAGCGNKYAVEGVTFRLVAFPDDGIVKLPDPNDTKNAINNLNLLRNRLAYRCFGIEEQLVGLNGQISFADDPFNFVGSYGAIDALRATGAMTDCEVPLALIYQTSMGLQICDIWSVRRSPLPPMSSTVWPLHAGERRRAEGMAMFLQFQDQLADLLAALKKSSTVKPAEVAARNYFHYLPPAGYLPLAAKNGFDDSTFFSGSDLVPAPSLLQFGFDQAYIRSIIDQSWHLDPIDLSTTFNLHIGLYTHRTHPRPPAFGVKDYLVFTRLYPFSTVGTSDNSASTGGQPVSTVGTPTNSVSIGGQTVLAVGTPGTSVVTGGQPINTNT